MKLTALAIALLAAVPAGAGERVAWIWDKADMPVWSASHAALLDRHILLAADAIRTRAGSHLPVSTATRVTPVLHVEVSTIHPPTNIEASRAAIVGAMLQAAAHSTSGRVQLDMEAKPSQRDFYRSLVRDVRAALPADIALSVTALGWWCRSPAWLDGLAADEVVPMFFRMGKDGAALRELVEHAPQSLHPSCRGGSAGFSPQEPFSEQTTGRYRRTYWFDYHAWRQTAAPRSP
ncbi:hypothetical protein Q4S45_22095 [Massilia sp. R2A-15]|uniref:hypothetical protein n=1 Tax=Massilia sp. R2A-15 TaxID=3064278 RepID=UPI002736DCF2|nr:hypothetical protein [Massilia sp. R2A-15]WLI89351.1 hypothetical protein Q4S45_22095 [Massilia sp. R2A-15]